MTATKLTTDKEKDEKSEQTETQIESSESSSEKPQHVTLTLSASFKKGSTCQTRGASATAILSLVFCGTAAVLCYLAVGIVFPIAQIVIGSIYLHECPRERYIPIYLIVAGCFAFVLTLSKGSSSHYRSKDGEKENTNGCSSSGNSEKDVEEGSSGCWFEASDGEKKRSGRWNFQDKEGEKKRKGGCCSSLVGLFTFIWFIVGSYWIYHIYDDYQSEDKSLPDYCDGSFYLTAFWMQTGQYILFGVLALVALIMCCFGVCIFAAASSSCKDEE